MIDGSEKRNRQLAFELHNLHVRESAVIHAKHCEDFFLQA